MKKAIFRLILVAVLAGAGYAAYRYIQKMPSRQLPCRRRESVREMSSCAASRAASSEPRARRR